MQDEDPNKGIDAAKAILKKNKLDETKENIFIVASCKDKGVQYLTGKGKVLIRKKEQAKSKENANHSNYSVELDGQIYNVKLDGNNVIVDGKEYPVSIVDAKSEIKSHKHTEAKEKNLIQAPMAGQVLKILKKKGDIVKEGDVVFMLEAMKMEIEVKTPFAGTIKNVLTSVGDSVYTNQELVEIQ